MSTTPKSRPPYPRELREQLIAMVRAGRSPEELTRDYEPSPQTIRNWIAQTDIDAGVVEGVTSDDRDELRRSAERTGSCARSGRS